MEGGHHATKRLTEQAVRKLRPTPNKQIDYHDTACPGLLLRISYGGTKNWRAMHYIDGKAKSYNLGRFPILNLNEAREKARTFLQNPLAALQQDNAEVLTFRAVTENFIKRHVEANGLRSQREIERCLDRYIFPAWADRAFVSIKRGDVAALLDHVEDNHGPRQADMVLAVISKMTRWYQARNDDYVAPVVPGMKRANGSKRNRILDDDEMRAVWAACEGTFGAMVKTLLLTAQRREKVATMRWDDVVDGEWRIPSEHREKSNAGTLRLPQAVLDIIEAQPRIADNPHVFAGRGTGPFNVSPSARPSLMQSCRRYAAVGDPRSEADGAVTHEPGQCPARHCRTCTWPCDCGR